MSDEQQRVLNEAQQAYREWLALQPKLEEAHDTMEESARLMAHLRAFYERDYRRLCEAQEKGAPLDLTTEGEYSVLSEDGVWNAMHEHDVLFWRLMRRAMRELDECRGG